VLTEAFMRAIGGMTANQLHRTYRRILAYTYRGGDGGGWDAPTLRVCHPHSYEALNAIAARYRVVAGEGER
jgi:hypothetical protein